MAVEVISFLGNFTVRRMTWMKWSYGVVAVCPKGSDLERARCSNREETDTKMQGAIYYS